MVKKHNTRRAESFRDAFEVTLPALFAYFPLAMVFGFVFEHYGFAWYLAPLMSAMIYGGSVQFLVLTMIDNGATFTAMLIAVFFVALRNLFYGLSFIERYKRVTPILKGFLSFGLVDATYAILLARPKAKLRFCLQVTTLIYIYWVLGTAVGAFFAEQIPTLAGADFVLPAFFAILVVDFYLIHRSVWPIVLPIVFSIIAYEIFPSNYLVLAICFSILYLSIQYISAQLQKDKL